MAIEMQTLETMIGEAFPEAQVNVQDLRGDGDHYAVQIVSRQFEGLSRIQQHQMVYAALQGKMGNELHAMALQTSAR